MRTAAELLLLIRVLRQSLTANDCEYLLRDINIDTPPEIYAEVITLRFLENYLKEIASTNNG